MTPPEISHDSRCRRSSDKVRQVVTGSETEHDRERNHSTPGPSADQTRSEASHNGSPRGVITALESDEVPGRALQEG